MLNHCYLHERSDRIQLVHILDNLIRVLVVPLDENSGVGLIQSNLTTNHRHQVLVADFDDFDEFREHWVTVDGNHLGRKWKFISLVT